MKIIHHEIKGLVEIIPEKFKDDRGWFLESYQEEKLKNIGIDTHFVQDNLSFSHKSVLRGLHLQKAPFAQDKLVTIIKGKVLDVVVDLRKNSQTYAKTAFFTLDDKQHNMLFIPKGFAHGFLALEDTLFHYKCSNFYHKPSETGIVWNDKTLNIDWPINKPIISEKDALLPSFQKLTHENLF